MARRKSTAAFLALIGGAFGIHKFYLGKTGTGVVYMFLLFTLVRIFGMPITVLLGFIDAVRLIGMSQSEFDEKYNSGERLSRRYRSRHVNKSRRQKKEEERSRRYRYEKPKKRVRKNPFKTSGDKKYEDYDLEDAVKDYEQALVISPEDMEIHFNMAAVYSLLENKKKSYYHLEKANELGYKKMNKVLEIDDFAFLRIQEDFEAFKEAGFKEERAKSIEPPKDDLLQDDLLLSQLNKLKNLREKGLLSEKEFLYEKEKLLKG